MAVTTWNIDPAHTDVLFSAKHMMVTTVRGKFHEVTGTITVDEDDPPKSGGSFTVNVASLSTGVEPRDQHLRSADFFDAERHPTATFIVDRCPRQGRQRLRRDRRPHDPRDHEARHLRRRAARLLHRA